MGDVAEIAKDHSKRLREIAERKVREAICIVMSAREILPPFDVAHELLGESHAALLAAEAKIMEGATYG